MKSKDLETKEAGYFAWAAARDAQFKSACESQNYSQSQKIAAERMKLALELCYFAKNIFITYRKKFITIKIDNPEIKDKKNLNILEKDYENAGYVKVKTAQGISYRIPKI